MRAISPYSAKSPKCCSSQVWSHIQAAGFPALLSLSNVPIMLGGFRRHMHRNMLNLGFNAKRV